MTTTPSVLKTPTTVRQRFFNFRCSQGPCLPANTDAQLLLKNQDKPLRYYNDDNKQAFIRSCQNRQLARDLLADKANGVIAGQSSLNSSDQLLSGIKIARKIDIDSNNGNRAVVEYEATRKSKRIAYHKAVLIPNAVHWCG